ncbi:MAG: hypothetical protein VKJ05_02375 [Synechococcaceae cyanobacterium]|nr:hypothetical protein [Synechococcaceae cyanobacterium]
MLLRVLAVVLALTAFGALTAVGSGVPDPASATAQERALRRRS